MLFRSIDRVAREQGASNGVAREEGAIYGVGRAQVAIYGVGREQGAIDGIGYPQSFHAHARHGAGMRFQQIQPWRLAVGIAGRQHHAF